MEKAKRRRGVCMCVRLRNEVGSCGRFTTQLREQTGDRTVRVPSTHQRERR